MDNTLVEDLNKKEDGDRFGDRFQAREESSKENRRSFIVIESEINRTIEEFEELS